MLGTTYLTKALVTYWLLAQDPHQYQTACIPLTTEYISTFLKCNQLCILFNCTLLKLLSAGRDAKLP